MGKGFMVQLLIKSMVHGATSWLFGHHKLEIHMGEILILGTILGWHHGIGECERHWQKLTFGDHVPMR